MKRVESLALVFFLVISFARTALATEASGGGGAGSVALVQDGGQDMSDSRRSAQYFLDLPQVHLFGSGSYSQLDGATSLGSTGFVFRFDPQKEVFTYWEVNGKIRVDVSRGDKPLRGFPRIKGEARSFFLYAALVNEKEQQQFATGQIFEPNKLNQDEGIFIPLKFQRIPWLEKFGNPNDPEVQNSVLIIGEQEYRYNTFWGGFFVSIDPSQPTYFIIKSSSGRVLKPDGVIDPLRPPNSGTPSTIGFAFGLPDDIIPVEFDENGQATLLNQELSSQTFLEVQTCPSGDCRPKRVYARSYPIVLNGACLFGTIESSDQKLMIVAERWVAQGPMTTLATATTASTYGNISVCGENKIVLTVYGESKSAISLYLQRNSGNPGKG